jgi:hypothetical protein
LLPAAGISFKERTAKQLLFENRTDSGLDPHARELVAHPERGGVSAGSSQHQAAERKRDLEEALAEVAWRKKLLRDLRGEQKPKKATQSAS